MTWTTEWPTAPGWYWFYGWAYGKIVVGEPEPPRLEAAQVHMAGPFSKRFLMTIRSGAFMYKSEGAIGMWCPMMMPELPDLSGLLPDEVKP